MPTYDYKCEKCGHEFAVFQGIKEEPKKRCPRCRSKVKRLITGGEFMLKGSGFYVTDYRKPEYKKAVEKEAAGAAPKVASPKPTAEKKKAGAEKAAG